MLRAEPVDGLAIAEGNAAFALEAVERVGVGDSNCRRECATGTRIVSPRHNGL